MELHAAGASPQSARPALEPLARAPRFAADRGPRVRQAPEPLGARLLLVDAHPDAMQQASIQMLRQQPFTVEQAFDLSEASDIIAGGGIDLVLLEIEIDGAPTLPFCLEVARARQVPVVIFSARAEPLDTVAAFEFGARDCIAKAAHPLEFLARTRAVLRHAPADSTGARGGLGWRFDQRDSSLLGPSGKTIYLAPSPAAVFREFAARPGVILDRLTLAHLLFGTADVLETRAVDVRVARLRRTLDYCDGASRMIRTHRPLGYAFNAKVQAAGAQQLTITLDS
jgi:DNA-binding response OmpR family regulator